VGEWESGSGGVLTSVGFFDGAHSDAEKHPSHENRCFPRPDAEYVSRKVKSLHLRGGYPTRYLMWEARASSAGICQISCEQVMLR
jgi:hypothetical protein